MTFEITPVPDPEPKSDLDILNEETKPKEEEPKVEAKPELEKEEEIEEEPKSKEKEEEKEEEIEEPEKEEVEFSPGIPRPTLKAIEKKFPGILKAFPDIRNMWYRENEFSKIYPSVDSAKEAREKAESYDSFEAAIESGDASFFVDSVGKFNRAALADFAHDFLPSIAKHDKQLHQELVQSVLNKVLKYVHDIGVQKNDDNLKYAPLHIANYLYGKGEIPPVAPRQRQFVPAEASFAEKASRSYVEEVRTDASNELYDLVDNAIKDLKVPSITKKALHREISSGIMEMMEKDDRYKTLMESLWKEAMNEVRAGAPRSSKPRLLSAFLGRAKSLLPAIKARKVAEALPNEPQDESTRGNKLPASGVSSKSSTLTVKIARDKKMNDMDIIMHGASD